MNSAIVDSVVLIAAMHARDTHHVESRKIVEAADQDELAPLVLTDLILAETLNYLTAKGSSAIGREALNRIEASQGLRIERTPDSVFSAGKNEVYTSIDGLSLVDAITVAHMRHRAINHIYSFDDDFDRVPEIQRLITPLT